MDEEKDDGEGSDSYLCRQMGSTVSEGLSKGAGTEDKMLELRLVGEALTSFSIPRIEYSKSLSMRKHLIVDGRDRRSLYMSQGANVEIACKESRETASIMNMLMVQRDMERFECYSGFGKISRSD